ncbi:MAG: sensor histidine kinase [Streptosporangiales bacterium]|nr:sensor histidine kinase [Streptosporangiales bacterium]
MPRLRWLLPSSGKGDEGGDRGRRGGFVHSVLFYGGPEEYLAGVVPFIGDGLSAGEPVAVAVPAPNLRLLGAELGKAAEQVRFVDMFQAGRNPGRIIPDVLGAFADTHPTGRVRIVGEPVWPSRSAMEYPACAQHEALVNLAFTGRAAAMLCPYDAAGLDGAVLADAAATHPVVVDGDGWRASVDYAPDRIVAAYNQPLPDPPDAAATLTVTGELLDEARSFTAAHARQLGLTGERVEDAVLVVAELAANSVAHGGGAGTMHIWGEHDCFVCQVRDAGHIRDPLAGRRPADPLQAGGRGLLLVNRLADLVRTHTTDNGTTIRVYLR